MSGAPIKATLVARRLTSLQAAALLLDDSSGDLDAAASALADRLKGLTGVEVQQYLGSKGSKVTLDFALKLQVDAVVQRKGCELSVVQLDDEHAVSNVDVDNGAGGHDASVAAVDVQAGGLVWSGKGGAA